MVKQYPAMDAWMWEVGQASQLIDDLETRIKNCGPDHLIEIKHSTKPKLLELGVKLDRLESLLRNPPSKPLLTEADIDLRWKLLSDIQLRTRVVALSLFAIRSSSRSRSVQSCPDTEEIRRSWSIHDQDGVATELSKDDPELLKPLIFADATQSHRQDQINECGLSPLKTCLQKACCIMGLILGALALLLGLFLLCTLL